MDYTCTESNARRTGDTPKRGCFYAVTKVFFRACKIGEKWKSQRLSWL